MDRTSHRVVLHADDLGMSRAVSDGIFRGFREGILTSTSVLANGVDAAPALEQWKTLASEQVAGKLRSAMARKRLDDLPQAFDLGVHLNLTQGQPLTGSRYPRELLDAEGQFPGVFSLVARLRRYGERFHAAIHDELEGQIQVVVEHGLRPTHVNGHQYIEMLPGVSRIVLDLLDRYEIKTVRVAREPAIWRSTVLRGQFFKWPLAVVKRRYARRFRATVDALGIAHPDVFFGTAHAGDVDLRLVQVFLAVAARPELRRPEPDKPFLVEIALHPGEASSDVHDPLAARRPKELEMLVSEALVEHLESAGWRLGRLSKV